MKLFKMNDLNKCEFFFSKPYNYVDKKYNIKCLLKHNDNTNMIIIQTPKMKLDSNLSSGYIVFSFYKNKKHNKLYDFIKNIETEASNIVKQNFKKKLILHSNITDDNKFIVNINYTTIPIFNNKGNNINFDSVDISSDFICLMKLQSVWVDLNKKKFGLNWNICQIKVYPELDYNVCYIEDSDDEDIDNKKNIVNEFVVQRCLFCNSECSFPNNASNIFKGKGKGVGFGMKGMGKGKGKGTIELSSGRGQKNIESSSKTQIKEEAKTDVNKGFIPSKDELINMRKKLTKMKKIHSDSD
tara:strand:+ start:657 stop:1550 length:894 start_codon:yes stop_codon:yes gene_type:complete